MKRNMLLIALLSGFVFIQAADYQPKVYRSSQERLLKDQIFGDLSISGSRGQLRNKMKKDPASIHALHELGCLYKAKKEYEHARLAFELAAEAGHVDSLIELDVCDRNPWEYGIDPQDLGLAMRVHHLECEGTV